MMFVVFVFVKGFFHPDFTTFHTVKSVACCVFLTALKTETAPTTGWFGPPKTQTRTLSTETNPKRGQPYAQRRQQGGSVKTLYKTTCDQSTQHRPKQSKDFNTPDLEHKHLANTFKSDSTHWRRKCGRNGLAGWCEWPGCKCWVARRVLRTAN